MLRGHHTPPSDTGGQKVQTSLFCPMQMSKGSRINSTLAPERYSATEPLVRFSSTPKIGPLHFTVEWACGNNQRNRRQRRDRREIIQQVVGERIKGAVQHVGVHDAETNRIAIRPRASSAADADAPICSAYVLNDDALPQRSSHPLSYDAPDHVG
jgi:hypothetical protein